MRLRRVVALKVLSSKMLQDDAAVARFDREMQAVGQLDHPNIVRASDAGEIDGTHYLVMELIKGDDLSVVVNRHGPLPVADACEVIRQAADGLAHAHAKGLVHRDIKPSNLMLTIDGQVKILDMGLALLDNQLGDDDGLTSTGQVMGTLDYISPEQVTNSHAVDIRADIYSLGCTLYKLLCGRSPFHENRYSNAVLKAMAHVNSTPTPLDDLRDGLSPQVMAIVNKMLRKDPDQRYQTPLELAEVLIAMTVGHDLPALLDGPPIERISVIEKSVGSESPTVDLTSASGDTFGDLSITETKKPARSSSKKKKKKPAAASVAGGGNWISNTQGKIAAASFGGFLALMAVVVMYLPTPNGTGRVEINDPSIQVTVSGDDRYRVEGKDGEFEIAAGEHNLEITAGGTTFQTKEFTLAKGEQVSLRVTLLDGNTVQVVDGKTVLDEHVLPQTRNVDRQASSIGKPADVARTGPAAMDKKAARTELRTPMATGQRTSLETSLWFSLPDDEVTFPTLEDDNDALTIELWLQRDPTHLEAHSLIAGFSGGTAINTNSKSALDFHAEGGVGVDDGPVTGQNVYGIGQPVHIAGVRDPEKQEIRVYYDGKLMQTSSGKLRRGGDSLQIGSNQYQWNGDDDGNRFHGWIDELRVSKSVRYQKDFKPQRRFDKDSDTAALYHFDEGTGDVLQDSSGNGHDGKIIGAKWINNSADASLPAGVRVDSLQELSSTSRLTDRQAVEFIFSKKAKAVVVAGGRRIEIEKSNQIPKQPFELRGILQDDEGGDPNQKINDADCKIFAQFLTIDQLNFNGSEVTKVGIREFASLPNLASLAMPRHTKDSIEIIGWFPNIRSIRPGYFETDAFLAAIRGNASIEALNLRRSTITAEGLPHLITLPNLRLLDATDSDLIRLDLQRLAELPRLEHLRLTLTDDVEIGALSALTKIDTLQTMTVFTPIVSRQTECDAYLKNVLPGCEMISFYNHGRLSEIIAKVSALGAESTPPKK